MNDTVYAILDVIDNTVFLCGVVITVYKAFTSKTNGIDRYRIIIKYATVFLTMMMICNTFMGVYRYHKWAVEQNDPSYEYVPFLAGIIYIVAFSAIVGVLWLIYYILNKNRKKRKA